MARDKIKRSFLWLRRTLEIIDKTTLPGEILGEVRATLDTFGWDRLPSEQFLQFVATAPQVAVASSTPPIDVLRVVLGASLEHTDTGVNHIAWLTKRRNPGPFDVGIPTDRQDIDVGEFMSMIGRTFLINNDFVIAEIIGAPVVGQITLRLITIDIPFGEYIPPL